MPTRDASDRPLVLVDADDTLWENYRFRHNLALLDFEQTSLNWLR